MRSFFLLAFVLVSASALHPKELKNKFVDFEQKFDKKYDTLAERINRFTIFAENLKKYEEHNNSGSKWTMGVTQFSDLTDQEFKALHLRGYINAAKPSGMSRKRDYEIDMKALPESVDWRDQGAITDVKNQGSCGSCWAFATVESIESYLQINTGKLEELSAQHITSCTPNPLKCGGTGGCKGSIPQLGFSYTQLFGLMKEADYPYTSGNWGNTGDCEYDANTMDAVATVRGYETLPRNDLAAVMDHLANKGPLSVAVDASRWSSYFGGVFDSCNFNSNIELNHAVQMVGYGTDPTEGDYWIVRNSWGGSWGEHGYIRLKRQSEAQCGTDSTPLMGTACVGDGNDVLHVCGQCGVLFDTVYPIGADSIMQ